MLPRAPRKAISRTTAGPIVSLLSITGAFPYFTLRTAVRKKKNWLFVGHPDAGDRAAVIYSLVISCQRHGHDPHAYLRDLLRRLPSMTTADDLRPLLPSQWRPQAVAAS